ncbi:MAG: hypothetical protein HBSAPP02_30920 [Phycisphaerae bacterium]|nr:MAG: HYR domain-containing protein [Planctomycetia bacterium]GJQ28060.1 MAG: hypothetical protein HBSAPP02_30920 [Phycisphaerae bacterium]
MGRKLVPFFVFVLSVAGNQPAKAGPPHFEGFENAGFTVNTVPNWNNFNSSLTRVASGTGGITSKTGAYHASIDSTLLPAPPNDYTGAFTRLGGYSSTFPATGFKASLDVYMNLDDPAVLNNTYGWDLSCAANNQSGGHRRDFIFHTAGSPGQILVGASNNTNFTRRNDLGSINHYAITASGWYTFEWVFRNNGVGVLAVDLNLRDSGGTLLWTETRSDASDLISTVVGGNRYMWFTFLEVETVAIDNTRLSSDNALSLEIVNPQSCYKEGDSICFQLRMSNLTQNATGFQAFLQFNNTLLAFNPGASSYTTSPFPVHIQSMASAEIAPGQINLDGAAPFVGPGSGGTNLDSLLATLCFTVNSGNDGSSTNFAFRTVPSFLSELSLNGVPIATALLNSQSFSIDQTPPAITCPSDVTVDCLSQVPLPATNLDEFIALPGASVTDACGMGEVTHASDDFAGNCMTGDVTITRTYLATDIAGHTTPCVQSITVLQDSTPPSITSVPPTKFLDCPEEIPDPYTTIDEFEADGGQVSDTCHLTILLHQTFQQGTCPLLILRVYRIYDECGNFSTFKDAIVVDDNTSPAIVGSDTSTVVDENCSATATLSATVMDNCGITPAQVSVGVATGSNAIYGAPVVVKTPIDAKTVEVSISVPVSDLSGCPATVTATLTAMDDCGNSAGPTNYTAYVTDDTPPSIVCDVVGGNLDGSCERLVTYSAVVEDNCCVNASDITCVVNTMGAAVFGTPNTQIVQNGANQVLVSGEILVSELTSCPATVEVVVNAADCCGNAAQTCTQSDTVQDASPPTIKCPADVNVFADAGECQASGVALGAPVVEDNCDGSPAVVGARNDALPLNDPYPIGTTTITWTATDSCGNSAECDQLVVVQPKNLVTATIELVGVVLPSPVQRCIRFIPRNGSNCGPSTHVNVTFSGGTGPSGPWAQGTVSDSDLQIPCGEWTSICAKDEQHTLSHDSLLSDLGPTYAAATTLSLLGGDTDNDNDVDINDVTLLLVQFGSIAGPNTCPWDGVRHADFSVNGVVLSEDYVFLSDNWQLFANCCSGSGWPIIGPEDSSHSPDKALAAQGSHHGFEWRIATSRLSQSDSQRADLNQDGYVDVEDIRIFERTNGLDGRLSRSLDSASVGSDGAIGATPVVPRELPMRR